MSDAVSAIKKLYFETSKSTVERDFERAIDLLKSIPSEDERERAAVYMDGLAQMKAQWAPTRLRPSGAPRSARSRGRSDRSTPFGRRPRSGD